jgi:hypothetical protein
MRSPAYLSTTAMLCAGLVVVLVLLVVGVRPLAVGIVLALLVAGAVIRLTRGQSG